MGIDFSALISLCLLRHLAASLRRQVMIPVASDWLISTVAEDVREIHRPVSQTQLGKA